MQQCLDCAADFLQRTTVVGTELERHADRIPNMEEINTQEKNLTGVLEEMTTRELLEDTRVMSELRGEIEAAQRRSTEIRQQMEARREVHER